MQVLSAEDLGKEVQQLRKAQGLTQEDLAGLSGVGRRFIIDIEKGKPSAQVGKILHVIGSLGAAIYISKVWDE